MPGTTSAAGTGPRILRFTRRHLFRLAGLASIAAVGGYTFFVEPHWLEVVRRPLPIPDLPESLIGRKVVQLSDLHIGPKVDSAYIRKALRLVGQLEPDLIVLTGDFMSCHGTEQIEEVVSVLRELEPAPLGTLAVLGNHDYALGWSRADVADQLTEALTALGIRVLRNDGHVVDGLRIIGFDDLWGPNFGAAGLWKHEEHRPALALCHNPDAADLAIWSGFRGWILSGHTHGGQCKPPFLPPPMLPVRNRRYTAGAFDLGNERWMYISRGLGHLMKVRFNVRPEVTLFQLQRA